MAYLVNSMVRLRAEIDGRWPHRQRRAEGWYTDPRVRYSYGHNPDAKGAVHAIDIDRVGVDPMWIIRHIYVGGHVLWYIIYNRTLYSRTYGGVPQPYHGSNPHTDHLHIECYRDPHAENYSGPWNIWALTSNPGSVIGGGIGVVLPSLVYGDADPTSPMNATSDALADAGSQLSSNARAISLIRQM